MAIDPGLLQAVLPPNMADRWKGDLASLDQNQFLLLATGHMGTAQNEMLWEAHLDDNDIALKKIYNHMYILLYTILYIYIVTTISHGCPSPLMAYDSHISDQGQISAVFTILRPYSWAFIFIRWGGQQVSIPLPFVPKFSNGPFSFFGADFCWGVY